MYDYNKAVKEDVEEFVNDEINLADFDSLEELENYLSDTLWAEDSITGNGSGSYTFSRYEAEENLTHNMDLLQNALAEFGQSLEDAIEQGPEFCDVSIRCYLLSNAISEVIENLEEDFEKAHEEEEEM